MGSNVVIRAGNIAHASRDRAPAIGRAFRPCRVRRATREVSHSPSSRAERDLRSRRNPVAAKPCLLRPLASVTGSQAYDGQSPLLSTVKAAVPVTGCQEAPRLPSSRVCRQASPPRPACCCEDQVDEAHQDGETKANGVRVVKTKKLRIKKQAAAVMKSAPSVDHQAGHTIGFNAGSPVSRVKPLSPTARSMC